MSYFPLRWETTGDQWWYASPIDWAAANGHYDLVRELLRIDANHLIQLTSLRRIRRLESVWDDERHSHDVASRRSDVARKLLAECDAKKGKNSLIGSGYGGWLLYTAASAGDLGFVRELLGRDPLLVFGEGEYGVTDILYAAAKSKNSEVFRVVLYFASSPRFSEERGGDVSSGYKAEIMNRALHAAARGGNLSLLKELIDGCFDDPLTFRDTQGATILHAASARGQLEVVEYLTSFSSMINSTDNQGNTALHVAAHRGHLPVVKALILESHSSINATNNAGETFLHSVISGFQTPGFRRLDRQINLLNHLLAGEKLFEVEKLINVRDNKGRTALHLAIDGNVHSDIVELVMSINGIDVNIRDTNGMTPLDILRRLPNSASSEILRKQLVSAGGIFDSHDYSTRKVIASHVRQSAGNSPGTSFRISDTEIFLYTGTENASDQSPEKVSRRDSNVENNRGSKRKPNKLDSVNYAAQRLKRLLQRPKVKKERSSESAKKLVDESSERVPVSLRQRFSKAQNKKRALSVWSNETSPTGNKKHAKGTMQSFTVPQKSCSSSFSKLSFSSQGSLGIPKGSQVENEMANASCS